MVPHNSINKFFNCYLALLLNVMFFFFRIIKCCVDGHFSEYPTSPHKANSNLCAHYLYSSVYIKRIQKVSYSFFSIKNTPKLINQQLKNGVKIVDWQKKVSYCLFYCQKYLYLKLKNLVKIVN